MSAAKATGITHETTDLRNAERLVEWHGDKLRHVGEWNKDLCWDGRRWAIDSTGAAMRLATDTVRRMLADARKELQDAQRREAQAKESGDPEGEQIASQAVAFAKARHAWAIKSQGASRLAAMLTLARSDARIAVSHKSLDADLMLLNVPSGTIDLRNGEQRPHRPEDLITKLAHVAVEADANCPKWDAFLEEVQPDPEVRIFLQRWAGYCLTGDTSERKFVFAHGGGRNGKSVIARVFRSLLGEYATVAPADLLLTSKNDRHPTELADLHGRRFVSCQEIPKGRTLNEQRVKELTGNDGAIKARRMGEDFWDVATTFKFWISGNAAPAVKDTTDSIWDRTCRIPFEVRIPDERVDKHFFERSLTTELPGILAWAVRGCLDWQKNGLPKPRAVVIATAAYRAEEDAFGRFLDDCCAFHATAKCTVKGLNEAYTEWCDANDETRLSAKDVVTELRRRGCDDRRKVNRARGWTGLRLLEPQEKQARDSEGDTRDTRDVSSLVFPKCENTPSHEAAKQKTDVPDVPDVPAASVALDPYDDGEELYEPGCFDDLLGGAA